MTDARFQWNCIPDDMKTLDYVNPYRSYNIRYVEIGVRDEDEIVMKKIDVIDGTNPTNFKKILQSAMYHLSNRPYKDNLFLACLLYHPNGNILFAERYAPLEYVKYVDYSRDIEYNVEIVDDVEGGKLLLVNNL
jgi:hypothetical protein